MNMSENNNRNPSGSGGGGGSSDALVGEPSRPTAQEQVGGGPMTTTTQIGIAAPGAASWHYTPPDPAAKRTSLDGRVASPRPLPVGLDGPNGLNLGSYSRPAVSNLVAPPLAQSPSTSSTSSNSSPQSRARLYFDLGLRLLFAYQHEEACQLFQACLRLAPDCALAHGMVALCHGPNYNFKGEAYYDSTDHPEQLYLEEMMASATGVSGDDPAADGNDPAAGSSSPTMVAAAPLEAAAAELAALEDLMNIFPSQQIATKHARSWRRKIEELRRRAPAADTSTADVGASRGRKRSATTANVGTSASVVASSMNVDDAEAVDDVSMHSRSQNSQNSSIVMEDASSLYDGASVGGGAGEASRHNSDVVQIVMDNVDDDDDNDEPIAAPQQPQQSQPIFPQQISQVEVDILGAINVLCAHPGIDPALSVETVGRPYANAMREVAKKYPDDPDVAYFFVESLMVLNAWSLYEYPTGRPLTPDVFEIRDVLERVLRLHPEHAGLCHLYVHLSEMSDDPAKALPACLPLRSKFPDAGHLVHMATHIDVLVGDYESCVRYNAKGIDADHKAIQVFPETSGTVSFYFGYIVHNYHMFVYGCILGGFEKKAMAIAQDLNQYLSEDVFLQNPDLTAYLESYAALDVHIMVRFGRWREILQLPPSKNPKLMLFRSASLRYARALAFANLGNIEAAKAESKAFDIHRTDPEAQNRILHNNSVAALLAVDAPMIRGEIAFKEGRHEAAFKLLRRAVQLQDGLHYDEPWGKMQPIRHALGGLLLEKGRAEEAEEVFRTDLKRHPKNPWSLKGLIDCLNMKLKLTHGGGGGGSACCASSASTSSETSAITTEMKELEIQLTEQRKSEFADYEIRKACACCLP